jgi:hypothetical protein
MPKGQVDLASVLAVGIRLQPHADVLEVMSPRAFVHIVVYYESRKRELRLMI